MKHQEAIINSLNPDFGATVSHSESRQNSVVAEFSDRSQKGVNTLTFIVDNKLCPDDSHIGQLSSGSNPEFHIFLRWRIDNKLI
jgi:hypothetical protein